MLIMNLIGMSGVVLTLIQNFYLLLLGRVIYGTAVGVQSVCMPRYVEEYVPFRNYSLCIAIYAFSMNFGNLFALCTAVFLPSDDDTQALMDDQVVWRIIFAFPLVWFTVSNIGFLFVIKNDGPSFLLVNNKVEEA